MKQVNIYCITIYELNLGLLDVVINGTVSIMVWRLA